MANSKPFTKQDLEKMILEVMELSSITPTIRRQINNFILVDKMTYKEIARCIVWYQEVFHGTFEPIYGISFVPSVKDRAAKYFRQLELDQQAQASEARKIVEYQENNIIFNIQSLEHKKRQPKQLDISEIDVKGDK